MILARFKSLQARLILLAAVSVGIALVIASVGFLANNLHSLQEAKRQQLQAQAEIVGFNSAAVLLVDDAVAGTQLLAPFSAQPTIDAAALYTENGKLLAQYTAPHAQPAPPQAPAAVGHRRSALGEAEFIQDVVEGGQRVGKLYLRANMRDLWQQTRDHLLISLVVIAVSLAAALPLAYFLAGAISRPILDLAHTADHITGQGDFTVRVHSTLNNEIGTLYRAFNELIEHVDAADRALKASQDELEQRVELRTAELQEQIHQRERIQQDLIVAKDAAEAASQAKSEFLANMSHEIRTPMNGVLGMTELVLETELSRDQRESMEMVKSSADALMVVINDILDFSKIEAGKMELDPTEFVVRDVLEGTLTSLALRAHGKNLEINCEIKPDVPQRVVGDSGRLRQVFVNLIGNAIKFTDRGEVTLRAELALESATEYCLRFSVIDTGIGIPPDKQNMIFEAFSQADGSMTRRYGGTGLGLTISSQLVTLMGGRLQVESEVGRGSTFFFEASFGKPGPAAAPTTKSTPANLNNLAVLIVDDNATNRRILEETLHNWGARPTLVDGGRAALKVLRLAASANKSFPLLLVDAMMPEMDGFELIEQIRKEPMLDRPAIMMLSSANSLGDGLRCRELGIASYLVKPIKSSELLSAILDVLGDRFNQKLPAPSAPLPPADASSMTRHLRILLAEDNPVNQRVAFRILEKRGYSVTVADNGKEALAALARASFDLVLMDVQMPEVDGLEATRAIRLKEAVSGGHLPIIAMTAHAMKGDRERCLAAGMDDYLSKPIDPELLTAALQRNAPPIQRSAVAAAADEQMGGAKPKASQSQSPPQAGAAEQLPSVDLAALRARLDGDTALVEEIIKLFLRTSPNMLQEVEAAVADADCQRIERAAHSLKGAASALFAGPCTSAAEQLETIGRSGELNGAERLLVTLQDELQRLRLAFEMVSRTPISGRGDNKYH